MWLRFLAVQIQMERIKLLMITFVDFLLCCLGHVIDTPRVHILYRNIEKPTELTDILLQTSRQVTKTDRHL